MGQNEAVSRYTEIALPKLRHLPNLPSSVRYYDKIAGIYRSIRDYANAPEISIHVGRNRKYRIVEFFDEITLMRHVIAHLFSSIDAITVATHLSIIMRTDAIQDFLRASLTLSPHEFRSWWIEYAGIHLKERQCGAFKAILRSMAELAISPWNKDYVKYISALPSLAKNRYNVVERGECFIPIHDQAAITGWLDDFSSRCAAAPDRFSTSELRRACILTASFQLGVRPIQLAAILMQDVTVRNGRIHVKVPFAKQGNVPPDFLIRRIKAEWSSPWIAYALRRRTLESVTHTHEQSFFQLIPERFNVVIAPVVEAICGRKWNIYDFRHTGAQRLADAGASREEIQDYLMHKSIDAANVYFTGSPSQAEKINRALGLSTIYQGVVKVAHAGMIDRQILEALPTDQQIGGVPHGIPISGIGGCHLGQSLCVKNPVLSCYSCEKFLPLKDSEIHSSVATSLRGVVKQFYAASSEMDASPAYGQLRRTIEQAEEYARGARAAGDKPL